jgi:hypothetical protein
MWGGANSSVLRRLLLGGLLVSLLTIISSGCSQDVRRFDYPVLNLAGPSDPATADIPADGSVALPRPQQ